MYRGISMSFISRHHQPNSATTMLCPRSWSQLSGTLWIYIGHYTHSVMLPRKWHRSARHGTEVADRGSANRVRVNRRTHLDLLLTTSTRTNDTRGRRVASKHVKGTKARLVSSPGFNPCRASHVDKMPSYSVLAAPVYIHTVNRHRRFPTPLPYS